MGLRDASVVARLYCGRDPPIQTGSCALVACEQLNLLRDVVEEAARRGAECPERFESGSVEGDARREAGVSARRNLV